MEMKWIAIHSVHGRSATVPEVGSIDTLKWRMRIRIENEYLPHVQ
jgi:hypothetical protein